MPQINANDLTREVSPYGFGIDQPKTALALRRLADDIEAGQVLINKACVYDVLLNGDFPGSTLLLTFVRKLPPIL
jgi:hypothetical protein